MSFILGLTGPTGSGKSTACRAAEKLGWLVIDCDKLARKATAQKETVDALTAVFGRDILAPDGSIDRKALAAKAFSSEKNTSLLNDTVLPFIVELIKEDIRTAGKENIILDAPTLYESGADKLCDAVCGLLSSPEKRKQRIMERDGLDEGAADLRMSAGKDDGYYKARTRHIIYNDADEQTLVCRFTQLLNDLGGQ